MSCSRTIPRIAHQRIVSFTPPPQQTRNQDMYHLQDHNTLYTTLPLSCSYRYKIPLQKVSYIEDATLSPEFQVKIIFFLLFPFESLWGPGHSIATRHRSIATTPSRRQSMAEIFHGMDRPSQVTSRKSQLPCFWLEWEKFSPWEKTQIPFHNGAVIVAGVCGQMIDRYKWSTD
jgi:hypothetical protein